MSDHKLDVNFKVDVPPSVDDAIGNLTNKPATSLGSGFADIFDLVFGPFSYLKQKQQIKYSAKLEQFKTEINDKINSIPEENLKEPDLQTVATALDSSKYCLDSNELRNMFANLISSTMDTRYCSQAHPSFAEIIKQMSPLDAQNLALFKNKDYPIAEYRREYKESASFTIILTNVFLGNESENDLDIQSSSISNLSRLGLIEVPFDTYYSDESRYKPFGETSLFLTHKSLKEDLVIQKGIVRKTPLGKSFINVCLP